MLRFIEAYPNYRTLGIQAGIYKGSFDEDECAVDVDSDESQPNIADQHKVGFFTLDRCSQTEVTEVVDLKEMTEVLQILLQDVTNLRRDINLTKHVMQADYESKLQEKSLELYVRINEKVRELERIHEDRVTTVRRAFRQQLSDAIARVAVLYNKNLESKIKKEKRKQEEGQGKHDEKYKEMQATIQRNETVIQMLKMQLAQFQQRRNSEVESPDISSDRPSNTTAGSPVPSLVINGFQGVLTTNSSTNNVEYMK